MLFYRCELPEIHATLIMAAKTKDQAVKGSGLAQNRFEALWKPHDPTCQDMREIAAANPGKVFSLSMGRPMLPPEAVTRLATSVISAWQEDQNLALARPDWEALHVRICELLYETNNHVTIGGSGPLIPGTRRLQDS